MTAPRTRIRASLLIAALFAGGLIAGACQPTEPVVIGEYHAPVDTPEGR